jgi:hypothetical protein
MRPGQQDVDRGPRAPGSRLSGVHRLVRRRAAERVIRETGVMRNGANRILAALVGAVVLLAVVAGVVVAHRTAPALDRGTPAGVVQAYLQAVIDGSYPAATALLSPSSGCGVQDVATSWTPTSAQVVLDHTAVDGDTAVVTVEVTEGAADDLFGSSGFSHTERFSLQRENGVWKITGSPWLPYSCASTKG